MKTSTPPRSYAAVLWLRHLVLVFASFVLVPCAFAAAGDAVHVTAEAGSPTVSIADGRLRQCIEEAFGKEADAPMTEAEMATLTGLHCRRIRNEQGQIVQVASLAGLEHATSLIDLNISGHAVSDLSPLSDLASLHRLVASGGAIADVSPLANLTGLAELRLAANNISNVTPLAGLTSLRTLDIGRNAIADISALASLTSLTYLGIYYNSLSDISVIKGMTGLERLSMYENSIADIGAMSSLRSLVDLKAENNDIWDIAALTANTGIGHATSLSLAQNPLGCVAVSAVAELEARGVSIHVDAADAVPAAPANLAVEVDGGTAILTWNGAETGTVRVHEARHRAGANGVFGNWEMVAGGGNSRSHKVLGIAEGSHAFEVRAVNSAGCGEAAQISTEPETATLVARAGEDQTVGEDGEAQLDGSRSSGPAGQTLAYSWRQTAGRPSITIEDADTAAPSFATPNLVAPATLTFELTVSAAEASATDTVDVTIDADNDPPRAHAGEDQTVAAGGSGRLDGGASSDPEGESLDYSWRQSAGEPSVALAESRTATPSFKTPSVTTNATLTFELTVTAGGASATDTVDVTIEAASPTVSIADGHLLQCVEKALQKEAGEPITEAEMATLTRLLCGRVTTSVDQRQDVRQVASLAGLEHATGLVELGILGHAVSDLSPLTGLASLRHLAASVGAAKDLSPLANLTGLTELYLGANRISDVSPLAGLTSLRSLGIGANDISDISALAGLTSLTYLAVYSNSITDISAIARMTGLERLYISDNVVADIGATSGLTDLADMTADNNGIWDITALTANTGIGATTSMSLTGNPLGCAAVSAVAELEARGVTIYVDAADAAPAAPANLAVEVDGGTATLTWDGDTGPVRVHEVRHRAGAKGNFGGWEMVPGGGASRSHSVPGLVEGSHAFEVRAVNSAGCSTAASASTDATPSVSVPDAALRYCLERKLQRASGSAITEFDMASIERLSCRPHQRGPHGAVESLEGLQFAVNLTDLNIRQNAVDDLSPLAKLPLRSLNIRSNAVGDLSPLAELPLQSLDIRRNAVDDLSPLAKLTGLTELDLSYNDISDVSPLANLTGLTKLSLFGNAVSDVSPLSGLTSLRDLSVGANDISDISSLARLIKLTELWLGGNAISDVSALAALTSLEQLSLPANAVSDVSTLANLGSLTYLGLGSNAIVDVSPLRDLVWLQDLRLSNNRIADIGALVQNLGFGRGDYIDIGGNPIPCGANAVQVQKLRARGVGVYADEGPLSPPRHLAGAPGDGSATLSWRVPEGCAVQHYEYRHGTGKSPVFHAWKAIGEGTSHTVSGLANGLRHAFEVRAVGATAGSEGDASGVVVALAADPDAAVEIHDPWLSQALAERLADGSEQNDDDDGERTITQADLATFTTLSLEDLSIAKLNGLEHALNLRALRLGGNDIASLAPIGDLPFLSALWLSDNSLQDISALRGLVELTELALDGNQISDIEALSDLSSLTRLWLNDNAITDIGPLVDNMGLGSGEVRLDGSSDYIDLRGNPLGAAALDDQAPALRDRGAAVLVDDGSRAVPVFLASGSSFGGSFIRLFSRAGKAGEVSIAAIDADGRRYGPTTVALGAGQTKRIDSDALEHGNSADGIDGLGGGEGDWRLELRSALSDLEVSAYTRTKAGLVASMNGAAAEAYAQHRVPMFDPTAAGGLNEQTSGLRVINPTAKLARGLIEGVDDEGHAAAVAIAVPAGASRDFTATALETGVGDGIVSGALGSATGKWRLRVTSYDGIRVLSLMWGAAQLTNLSLMPDSPQHLPLIPAAEWPAEREGFLRFVNDSSAAVSLEIRAFDRDGRAREPVSLTIGAASAVEFTPHDLAQGSATKGLPKGVGEGVWRLELSSSSAVYASSYMGVGNGAPLVAMHSLAPRRASGASDVVFFNPASDSLASRLRLVNVGAVPARVAITGIDDDGRSPGRGAHVTVPAGATREFTASELEAGDAAGLSGELGKGGSKWRLRVESDGEIFVVSLVESRTGYVGNVSR